jgi:hypothetical protein
MESIFIIVMPSIPFFIVLNFDGWDMGPATGKALVNCNQNGKHQEEMLRVKKSSSGDSVSGTFFLALLKSWIRSCYLSVS